MARAGDSFWFRGSAPKEHLHVVLTDPDENGKVLVANITAYDNIPKGHLIDIPSRQKLLVCGWKTSERSSIFKQVSLLNDVAVDRLLSDRTSRPSRLTQVWLIRIRKAVCKLNMSAPEGDVISNHFDAWSSAREPKN